MNQKDSIWNKVSAPVVLLALTAAFTGLYVSPSYESARPRSLTLNYDPVRSAGRANGLITFDPLEQAYGEVEQVVKEFIANKDAPQPPTESEGRARFSFDELARGLADAKKLYQPAKEGEQVLVLLESVRGGALSEDHERRLRGRYATVAALARERIFPAHSKRLNLLWFADSSKSEGKPQEAFADPLLGGVLVPYEFFERGAASDSPYARVVVCWVDEAAIERNPLEFGLQFDRRVRDAVDDVSASSEVDVRWLGPTTSTGLKSMLHCLDALPRERLDTDLKIVTPYATSPLVKLKSEVPWDEHRLSISRSVNTDDVLARLLVNELMLRVPALMPMQHGPGAACASAEELPHGPVAPSEDREAKSDAADETWDQASPWWARALAAPLRWPWVRFLPPPRCGEPVRVALITEMDSTYGQAWVANMIAARDELAGAPSLRGRHLQLHDIEFTVFPVFGWVDGVVRESTDKRDASAATALARDYPAEAHQLDYLGRLRDELQSEGKFSAIAIFVTEEYDTMLILEALRPKFPGAMFLTTDLDARYLQARHAPFTRNLIVASHFGLVPADADASGRADREGVVRAAPEFRDGYQTSVWHAVRALARNAEPKSPPTASIYEVGRSRFVRLNCEAGPRVDEKLRTPHVAKAAPDGTPVERVAEFFSSVGVQAAESESSKQAGGSARAAEVRVASQAAGSSGPPLGIHIWALCSVAALLLGLLVFSTRAGREAQGRGRADSKTLLKFGAICGVLFLFAVGAVLVELTQRAYPAEPVALLEGVSAWPTITLRLLMALVSLSALLAIPLRLRRAEREIALRHEIAPSDEPVRAAWVLDWAFIDEANGPVGGAEPKGRLARAWFHLRRSAAGVRSAILFVIGLRRRAPKVESRSLEQVWAFVRAAVRRPGTTWARMLCMGLALYFCIAPFFALAGQMANPVRGEFAYLIERVSLFTSVFSFLMLMMLVMETTFFASRLVSQLVDPATVVLPRSVSAPALDRRQRLLLAQDIARVVDPLVWSPMIVLGLMIFSRASVFDAWPWPQVLVGVLSLFFVMMLMCIVSLRRQCEQARVLALADLAVLSESEGLAEQAKKQLATIRSELQALAGGSFSPLIQHPILRALSLPLTAFGANLAFERNLLERFLGSL